MSTKIKISPSGRNLLALADWLIANMENPPLPDTQRFNIVEHDDQTFIEFTEEKDAILYSLSFKEVQD